MIAPFPPKAPHAEKPPTQKPAPKPATHASKSMSNPAPQAQRSSIKPLNIGDLIRRTSPPSHETPKAEKPAPKRPVRLYASSHVFDDIDDIWEVFEVFSLTNTVTRPIIIEDIQGYIYPAFDTKEAMTAFEEFVNAVARRFDTVDGLKNARLRQPQEGAHVFLRTKPDVSDMKLVAWMITTVLGEVYASGEWLMFERQEDAEQFDIWRSAL